MSEPSADKGALSRRAFLKTGVAAVVALTAEGGKNIAEAASGLNLEQHDLIRAGIPQDIVVNTGGEDVLRLVERAEGNGLSLAFGHALDTCINDVAEIRDERRFVTLEQLEGALLRAMPFKERDKELIRGAFEVASQNAGRIDGKFGGKDSPVAVGGIKLDVEPKRSFVLYDLVKDREGSIFLARASLPYLHTAGGNALMGGIDIPLVIDAVGARKEGGSPMDPIKDYQYSTREILVGKRRVTVLDNLLVTQDIRQASVLEGIGSIGKEGNPIRVQFPHPGM